MNDTAKAVTGFPLTYFIQQEVINKAQRLLYYSEMSIKEIAYTLGYEDDKYFIRLFGKSTGSSPAVFRKNKATRSW
ncbi:helix-turn-helix domain-containing protein [Dyadobacter sp. 3J3]|uniref:helix-turn-helix domain-containing protein n=1 Tax=Dyadobacter sp. 3J3 TaxID=2606600 RepID=UPI0038D4C639